MNKQYRPPALGLAAATAITATMDATGFFLFSALPLLPLAGLFWYLQGFSRPEIGLVRGPAAGWGLLRLLSGSLVVASVAHAFWNGIDYPLYGFGEKVGALGIRETHVFGPEVGWLGIVFNLVTVAVLFALARRARVAR